MFPLHLFPTAGFDRSTTTPVLVGLLVSWFFTETFGWVFAGLVVPGYLAAVFAIDPRAGVVDVAEALFTYGLARALGEHLPKTGLTSRVFGRERFLLIVLCSVVVRLALEGALLPRFAPHAAGSFFSIGLVVVPLAANACWKTGLYRGVVQNGVPTLLTWLVLRFVLLPYTNLSLAGFQLATEDVAASFLDSPKAYILLITGAMLAAASNLLDGWDFHGILVPALLSLIILEPIKLGATFVEALLVWAIAAQLLARTRLGRANVEGPRRLVLFFSVDYAMRFGFAALVGRSLPGADVVALMGFGYLLPTLLAVKIAQKGSVAQVLLPTAQVSALSFGVGTLIGFSASLVDAAPAARTPVTRPLAALPTEPEAAGLLLASLARKERRDGAPPASPAFSFEAGEPIEQGLRVMRERFQTLEERVGDPTIVAAESVKTAGRHVVLLVERPVSVPEHGALAARWVSKGNADAVVIAGVEGDPTALATAQRLASSGAVLALRRTTGEARLVLRRKEQPARVLALTTELAPQLGPIATVEDASLVSDAALELPDTALLTLLSRAREDSPSASLASPSALSEVLSDVRASTSSSSLEELLALRRLLLEPLLSPGGVAASPASLPLLRLRARRLGYALIGPTSLGDGGEGLALVPTASRPLALFVRATGVASTVVEVAHGAQDAMRDAGVRVGRALGADAILFGLEPLGGARGGLSLRLAHAVASAEVDGRTPRVVFVQRDLEQTDATIASWGPSGPLLAEVSDALRSLGVATTPGPLDLRAREIGGRAVFGPTPLAVLTLDEGALEHLSLDAARFAARAFGSAVDGDLPSAAQKLSASILDGLAPPEVDVEGLSLRVAREQSIVARRALAHASQRSAVATSLVRTPQGDFLLSVARTRKELRATAVPLGSDGPRPSPPLLVGSLAECGKAFAAGSTCIVAHP